MFDRVLNTPLPFKRLRWNLVGKKDYDKNSLNTFSKRDGISLSAVFIVLGVEI